MKRLAAVVLALVALGVGNDGTTTLTAQEVGPANGSLVVVGGAMRDINIVRRFLDLAGGPDAPIVVIPTAGGGDEYDDFYPGLRQFRAAGATNLTVLHTNDRDEANSDAFVKPIQEAGGVWFPGGRQWRIADSYLHTRTHQELNNVLERGGVIGGSSAGASIQGSYLVRGDTQTNEVMMGDHEEGFGFLRNVGVDQHLIRRNRQFDMLEVIDAMPNLLGIGIDENTAIVVQGDNFDVMGAGYVAIYDSGTQLDSGGQFYFLAPGDRFNMATREAVRPTTTTQPLARVERKPGGGR